MGVIADIKGLDRSFGKVHAVNRISFTCETGKIIGFIGPNGAGKTTTMRILATLDAPDGGDAFICGYSIINDPDKVRPRIGFMPESANTYSNLDVEETLDFYARAYKLRGRRRRETVEAVLTFTDLMGLRHRPADGLSKGMMQRLLLARALLHDPALLILDEPAAGLDPRARIELRELTRQLAADGKTLLISSHILTELSEICDAVVIIEQGRIVAAGDVEDIQRGIQHRQTLQLRLLDYHAEAERFLLEQPLVMRVSVAAPWLKVEAEMDEAQQADLLARLVAAGFRVVEFRPAGKDLEDMFMTLTKGKLQ